MSGSRVGQASLARGTRYLGTYGEVYGAICETRMACPNMG